MFTPGDKLEYGHYTILRELGAGGMGVVYHCRDEFLQREIAIKMLLPELMADDDTVEVFRQEARLAAQLEHPNVVTIHNIGLENREGKVHHYIAMEFLPGGSLKQRITGERFSMEQCLEWMKQLAIGLNYAHKRGVVHQDIKPDNIFITQDGNLKIGDFGLALIATGVAVERAVQGKGTPAYMSPELCQGDPQDHRSDLYSLGTVFYELVTRERPFKASGMIEMAMKHATAPIPSARKINPDVPEVLDKCIQKMMAKSPDDRYQSLSEVLTILEKLLLEVQVARLGVGTSKAIEPKKETAKEPAKETPKEKEKTPAPAPNISEAQDFANFLKEQTSGDGAPEPVKAPEPVPQEKGSDTLDDLLADLLTEKEAAEAAEAAKRFDGDPFEETIQPFSLPPAAEEKQPEPQAAGDIPQRSKFDADVTGEIDVVFQSVIRAEAAQMAQQVQSPKSESPRASRTAIPAVGVKQLDVLWSVRTAGPIGWASMPVSSRDRKTIYVASSDGYLYALDANDGKIHWRYDTGAAVVASPVIAKERIIVASSNGSLHALTQHGTKVWDYSSTSPLVATPIVRNEDLLLSSMDGTVKFLNGADGTVRWTYRTDGPIVSSPEVLENLVLISSKDKCVHAVSIDRGWRQWVYQTQAPIVAGPLASTDSVYAGSTDGTLYSLEAETGKLVWKYPTDKPIVSRGTLEFTSLTVCSEDKYIHCIEKYKGELLWKAHLHSPVMTNLISSAGSLYVANREGWLQCFNLKNGELKWQMDCEKRLESAPLVSGRTLYQGMVSGDLVAYALPN